MSTLIAFIQHLVDYNNGALPLLLGSRLRLSGIHPLAGVSPHHCIFPNQPQYMTPNLCNSHSRIWKSKR